MSKKFFAKKFVAYSMAFAVAFASVNVSPIFVKDAQAAAGKITIGVSQEESDTDTDGIVDAEDNEIKYVEDGMKWIDISSVTSSDTTVYPGKALDLFVEDADLEGFGAGYLTNEGKIVEDASGNKVETNTYEYKLNNVNIQGDAIEENRVYLFDGIDNKDKELAATPYETTTVEYVEATDDATHKYDEDAGEYVVDNDNPTHKEVSTTHQNGVAWFKLNPVKGEFTYTQTGVETPRSATVSYTYYVAELITTMGSDSASFNYQLGTVSENAIYMAVNSEKDGLGNVLAVYNVCEKTDLKDVATARKAITYSQVGKTAKMSVDVKTRRTNPNLTYKWTKSSKVLDCTEATLSLTDLTDSDFDYYQCEVSDGIATKKVEFTLKKLGTTELATGASNVQTLATDVNVLVGGKVASGVVSLTTSIPEGDFVYLWGQGGNLTVEPKEYPTAVDFPEADVLNYSNTKRTVSIIFDKTTEVADPVINCYAILKKDYDDAIAETGDLNGEMEAIEEATTTVSKHTAIQTLRSQEFVELVEGAVYTETFTLRESDATNVAGKIFFKSEKKDVKFGDTVTLSAPTVKGYNTEYVWSDASGKVRGNEDKLVIDTVDHQDLGMITLVVTSCGKDHTHKSTGDDKCVLGVCVNDEDEHNCADDDAICEIEDVTTIVTFNMSYVSDLDATANDVEAKANAKNVVLSVDATSSLDINYTWTLEQCSKSGNTVTWTPVASGDLPISLTDAGTDKTDATLELQTIGDCFYKGEVDESYRFVCTVDDGMAQKDVVVKVKEISTFKVYLTDTDKENEKDITNDNINDPFAVPALSGVEGSEVVLAPIVDVKEGINVTYAWTCPQDPTFNSTDSKITVKYPKNSPVNYVLVIKEETKKVILQYTLNTIEKEDISITIVDEAEDESDINTIVTADKEVVYTGTEINPVKSIVVELDGSNYTLVEGTDYDVTLANAVNVGRGTYKITFKGVFEKDTTGAANKTISGEFYINRAENEIEIAAVEGSLQPKTIKNPAKAALTYTYYTDEACTNAVEGVPTVAGDYYVVATSDATANYNAGKSNVVKVTVAEEVKVGTVSDLKVTKRTSSTITVAYKAADNATGYRVYYKNANTNGKYVRFAQGTKLGCIANNKVAKMIAGATTKIAVKAYKMVDGKAVWADKYVEVTTKTAPGKTSKVAVTTTKNAAKIAWNKVSGANGYRVYVKTSAGWKKIAQGNNLTYTYKNLKRNTTYTFAVRAFNTVDGKSVLADNYVTKSAKTK